MGRRPNQLVLEYFDRGAKLEDNSNRYEHRCKACGQHFPKGRIESLTSHIDRSCPSIRRDRFGHLSLSSHHSPHPPTPLRDGTIIDKSEHSNGQASKEHRKVLPVNGRSSRLTGLEALAEASRQLEHPTKADTVQPTQNHLIDPDLERAYSVLKHQSFGTVLGGNVSYHAYSTAVADGSHATSNAPNLGSYIHHEHRLMGAQDSQDPTMLSLIAASASKLEATMPQAEEEQQNHETNCPSPTTTQQRFGSEAPTAHLGTPGSSKSCPIPATNSQINVVPEDPATGTSGPERVSKNPNRSCEKLHGRAQKVRGKFTDSRRQEVQNIRKKGACLRCRMLRKTCSGESPCKTCASVMSARVWKLDCMRTNIYKELDIFHPGLKDSGSPTATPRATGLFEGLSLRLFERWNSRSGSEADPCFLQIAHTNRDASPMVFPARRQKLGIENNARVYEADSEPSDESMIFFDESKEQISSTLLAHMESGVSRLDDSDPHNLMGPTLRLASTLTREGHDRLLEQALDLCALTQIMTSDQDDWQCFPCPSRACAEEARQPSTPSEVYTNPILVRSESRECITTQLKAAAEHRASMMSKNVMIDLERRLERKEKCQGLQTFLVGFLLLNCVERMCWVFQCMNDGAKGANWPLEKPVEFYLDQAARFAEFLSRLYKMRGILLQLHQKAKDDILHTNATLAPMADQWLNEMKLTSKSTATDLRGDMVRKLIRMQTKDFMNGEKHLSTSPTIDVSISDSAHNYWKWKVDFGSR